MSDNDAERADVHRSLERYLPPDLCRIVTGYTFMLMYRAVAVLNHAKAVWSVSVCFSPDGSQVVSGSRDGTVRIWEVLA